MLGDESDLERRKTGIGNGHTGDAKRNSLNSTDVKFFQ